MHQYSIYKLAKFAALLVKGREGKISQNICQFV